METITKGKYYSLCKEDKMFYILEGDNFVETPNGNKLVTSYEALAKQLYDDIVEQGEDSYTFPDSILSYHYTMLDNFRSFEQEEIVEMLNDLNWERNWSFQNCPSACPDTMIEWSVLFGYQNERIDLIHEWLKNCTHMQLTAITCVYNAFMNMNMSYLMAYIVEVVPEENHKKAINDIMNFYRHFDDQYSTKEVWDIFTRFRLYYGIHFEEDGPHIPKEENVACEHSEKEKSDNIDHAVALKTLGDEYVRNQEFDQAISSYKEAVELAPSLKEIWNNLGGVYGMTNQHKKALNSYEEALKIDSTYLNALYGKAVALKNLQLYEESLSTIDRLLSLKDNESAQTFRSNLLNLMNGKKIDFKDFESQYFKFILDAAYQVGLLKQMSCPNVPELWMLYDELYQPIYKRLYDYHKGKVDAEKHIDFSISSFMFSAGVGIAAHWHENWAQIKTYGAFDILTQERGLDEMDEYCMEHVGINFNSPQAEGIRKFIAHMLYLASNKFVELENDAMFRENYIYHRSRCFYMLGMVFQLQRMGYR